jgi:competence ComEA-like helix-hairpin-helix protein
MHRVHIVPISLVISGLVALSSPSDTLAQKSTLEKVRDTAHQYSQKLQAQGQHGLKRLDEKINNKKININTANEATLRQLKGIGKKRAQAIIEYRKQHGPFQSVEALKQVPLTYLPAKVVDANRERLTT